MRSRAQLFLWIFISTQYGLLGNWVVCSDSHLM